MARFRALEVQTRNERIIAEQNHDADAGIPLPGASADDDELRRGLPMIGPGVAGAIPGTDPLRAVLAAERRRRRC
jgi:hypothetical protein